MSSIWAVARQMIAEAIRMRVALFVICLLLLLIIGLPFVARGDNTVSGLVQSFLTYAVTAVSFLLALLTLFMSRSLSDELVQRQIYTLMTKPLPRWKYIVGKWLGIVLFDLALLLIAGAGIWGMTRFIAATVSPRDARDRQRLTDEILTARHHAAAIIPRELFKTKADDVFEQRKEEGLYADVTEFDPKQIKADLERGAETAWRNVPPFDSRIFRFENVRCERGEGRTIQIRYKCQALNYPLDEVIRSLWIVGDPDRVQPRAVRRRDVHDRYHTFSVPADTVAPDGTLTILFQNVNPYVGDPSYPGEVHYPNVVRFEGDAVAEVLFRVGSFEGNLVRILVLILCKLMFLAALGLLATSLFSFPVAMLVSLTVYTLAALRGFIGETLEFLGEGTAIAVFQTIFGLVLRAVYLVIPDFSYYDAVNTLVDGRNVTLLWVLQGLGALVGLQTAVLLLLACLVFHRREVAEVSV